MLHIIRLSCMALVLGALGSVSQASLIYSFEDYANFQNGHTLSGTITTTDSAPDDGLLVSAEILDWSFSVIGPNGFSASKNANSPPEVFGEVGISATQITIGFPPNEPEANELNFQTGLGQFPQLRYLQINDPFGAGVIEQYEAGLSGSAWQTFPNALGGNPWVVATAAVTAAPLPEPSSLLVWSLASSLVGLMWWRRRA